MSIFYKRRRPPEMKFHTVRFMRLANQISELAAEDFFQRQRFPSDNGHLELSLSKGRRNFEADKTCAEDDDSVRVFRLFNQLAAIGESSQITNVRQIVARNSQADRFGASSKLMPARNCHANPVADSSATFTTVPPMDSVF